MSGRPLIFVVAGEASGDLHAARVMAALRDATGNAVGFAGIGGPRMQAQGLESLFPMEELSLFGLVEVLPKIRSLLARIRLTRAAALACAPDVLFTIDSPGFNFRLGRGLHGQRTFPHIHLVPPTVWAYRPGRAKSIAGFLDHLVAIFPFEPPLFERHGLPCSFFGHPLVESAAGTGDGRRFRAAHGVAPDAPLICVLPGSRRAEVARMVPVFGEALRLLAAETPGLRVVVPTAPAVHGTVAAAVAAWPGRPILAQGDGDKFDAFAASTVALPVSGTVTLELAFAGVPHVTSYKLARTTYLAARMMARTKFIHMVNIIADHPVIPEYIQDRCTPTALAAGIRLLLTDDGARTAQKVAMAAAVASLEPPGPRPSEGIAGLILDHVGRSPRRLPAPGAR